MLGVLCCFRCCRRRPVDPTDSDDDATVALSDSSNSSSEEGNDGANRWTFDGRVFERRHAPYGGLVVTGPPPSDEDAGEGASESVALTVSLTPRHDREAYRRTLEDAAVATVLERLRPLGVCSAVTRVHVNVDLTAAAATAAAAAASVSSEATTLEMDDLPSGSGPRPVNTYRDVDDDDGGGADDSSDGATVARSDADDDDDDVDASIRELSVPRAAAAVRIDVDSADAVRRNDVGWTQLTRNAFTGVVLVTTPQCVPVTSSVADVAWRSHATTLVAQAVYGLAALHAAGLIWSRLRPGGSAACYPWLGARTPPTRRAVWHLNGVALWTEACGFDVQLVNLADTSVDATPFAVAPEELLGLPVTRRTDTWLLAWSLATAIGGAASPTLHPALPLPARLDEILYGGDPDAATTRRLWSAVAQRARAGTTLAAVAHFAWALVCFLDLPDVPEAANSPVVNLLRRAQLLEPALTARPAPVALMQARAALFASLGGRTSPVAQMLRWDPLARPLAHVAAAQVAPPTPPSDGSATPAAAPRNTLWVEATSGWLIDPVARDAKRDQMALVLVRQARLLPPKAVHPERRFVRLVPRWLLKHLARTPKTQPDALIVTASAASTYCVMCGHLPAPLKEGPFCGAMCARWAGGAAKKK